MRKLIVALFLLLAAPSVAGILPLLGVGVKQSTGAGSCSQSSAFFARTSGLDITHTNAYDALICGLVTDGIYSKFDILYVFATQDSTTALLNLASSSFNGTVHGAPTFTADSGYAGVDGSTTVYVDTNYNPSTAGGQYTQGLAHISLWNLTNATSTFPAFGSAGTGINNLIFPKYSDNNVYFRVNSTNVGGSQANSDPRGHYIGNRTGASVETWRNGGALTTISNTQQTIVNANFYVIGFNNIGVVLGSGLQIASASAGAYLNATDSGNFYTRLRTYMTAVGVP